MVVLSLSVLVLGLSSAHPLTFQKTPQWEAAVPSPGGFDPHVLNVVCPDGEECPNGNSCCSIGGGKYACCTEPDAECCPDKTHCCRKDYVCGENTCTKGFEGHPLVQLVIRPKTPPPLRNIVCPDGKQECPTGDTCCSIGGPAYGCCPKSNAVCCKDMKHCCPQHYTCGTTGCSLGSEGHPLLQLVTRPADESLPRLLSVVCPDKKSECPDGDTCCLVGSSKYGCCPKANATCCSDMKHCCPQGYLCEDGKCSLQDSSLPFLQLVASYVKNTPSLQNITCPGGNYQCPDASTCCPGPDGKYGCCPISDAYCCSDMVHCCPKPYTCSDGKCVSGNSDHPLLQLVSPPLVKEPPPPVQGTECPDHVMYCPGSDTCCRMEGGGYGCCQQEEAVCCDDLKHCCAKGYACKSGKCLKDGSPLPFLQLVGSPVEDYPPPANILCPDKKSECPNGNTCCLMPNGIYGCCPKPNGVCCDDMIHCCPEGYICDTPDGKCYGDHSEHPLLRLLSRPVHEAPPPVKNIFCPGNKQQCPDSNTCCSVGGDQYKCCPKKDAVCCDDKQHCCPEGFTCGDGKCLSENSHRPLLQLVGSPPSIAGEL